MPIKAFQEREKDMTNQDNLVVDINSLGRPSQAEIYLGGGCFWGVEGYFQKVSGILDTQVGYANGKTPETSYRQLADTGHVEALKLVYNPNKIHLAEILERFYRIIDPFSLNNQGADYGTQYRTGIYYTDEASGKLAKYSLENFESLVGRKTAVELEALDHFIEAEDYHQDYLIKNPTGYCHINIAKASETLFPGRDLPDDEVLEEDLSMLSYKVIREGATEKPHTSPLDQEFTQGIYVDISTGQPLFSSLDKYDAGCGWPSFTKPITTDVLAYYQDLSYGYDRVEVQATNTNHLGHVFEDGPVDQGSLRYCINGAALRFIPLADMDSVGYGALKPFVYQPE